MNRPAIAVAGLFCNGSTGTATYIAAFAYMSSERQLSAFVKGKKKLKRKKSVRITAELAATIKYLYLIKKLYQHQIASLIGVNQGRISEVISGKKFPDAPPAMLVAIPLP